MNFARFAPLRLPLLAALALLLAGCAARDAHVPDFARKPYEPFSRSAAIAVAEREWRLFGQPVAALDAATEASGPAQSLERAQGLWQRVGEYWWLGLDADQTGHGYTGLHDEQGRRFAPERDGAYAWSAAFVSYVMRIAGAGERFPYGASHFIYVNAAVRGSPILRAEDPERYAPQAGDLVCVARDPAKSLAFKDLPLARFWGHCDIAVRRDGETLAVIGGNVEDAVTLRRMPLLPDGRLAPLAERPWLVVLRVIYDAP